MVLPVSDHVRRPGEDGIPENLPCTEDLLGGDLHGRILVKSQHTVESD